MTVIQKPEINAEPTSRAGRIVKAECILVALPLQADAKPVWAFSSAPKNTFDTLFVRLETDTGLVGWGEAFSRTEDLSLKSLIETRILPLVIGEDARQIAAIKHKLEFGLHNFGRVGPTMYGISAVDIALWDIAAKAAGLPLVDLLGGPVAGEVEVYASLLRYDSEEGVAAAVRAAVAEGYRYIKLHETTYPEIAAACAAAAGQAAVMLDVNCPWSVTEALEMDARLAPLNLFWFEEPVWPPENFRGLARIRAEKRHRIAAGENAGSLHGFVAMVDAGAIDIAQPDVAKTGGVTELLKIAAFCEASAIQFVPHCALFGPGLLATIHINASRQPVPLLERLYCQFDADLYRGATSPVAGKLAVPRTPGLGFEPDPDVIDRYRVG
ncbi:mandelate racemase/muconate lactonizing enzyme family protein [Bradyrhizobium sp. CCBAU 45394]|uniref:mandelate racemase/muconate lactonizing enzyme family protein n=1 Tax=Bradyrhizobium sp. CCBAU 45394 TaxID=1325087 RepID=UPI002303C0BB|nr:mandelate racemase/muconate lactonizing enzyme family protein [Bradyrhizobium sp. CCBAU 45394]